MLGQNMDAGTYLEERPASCCETVGNHVGDEECGCAGKIICEVVNNLIRIFDHLE